MVIHTFTCKRCNEVISWIPGYGNYLSELEEELKQHIENCKATNLISKRIGSAGGKR